MLLVMLYLFLHVSWIFNKTFSIYISNVKFVCNKYVLVITVMSSVYVL